MKTIGSVLRQMTDAKSILRDLCDTLKEIDPEYPEAETRFQKAAADLERELGDSTVPSVSEYLAAREEEFAMELIYIGWQGFRLNLDIFANPANAVLLTGDFEDLHRECQLGTIPTAEKAREVQAAFRSALKGLPEETGNLIDGVTEFYSYLQTAGYKIAHYFGFRLADLFLPYVIPGYSSSQVESLRYAQKLERFMQIRLDPLG